MGKIIVSYGEKLEPVRDLFLGSKTNPEQAHKQRRNMKAKRIIVWFRQNLRLHDNESLINALQRGDEIIPIYVFDERVFKAKTSFGFPKTGRFRAQFMLESVADLKASLQALGADLIIRVGKPEEEIFKIAQELHTNWVFTNMERMAEEVAIQNELERKLWSVGQELYFFRGKMLYYTQDLPFPISQTPEVFTQYRKEVEKIVQVREPFATPTHIPPCALPLKLGELPSLEDFGHESFTEAELAALPFKGGETAALARLKYYLWDTDLIQNYKESRNGLLGGDYSSKLSSWLANGCLSPKMVYSELRRYERERKSNESTYWLFFELLWRDYFRLMGKKHGSKLFQKGGLLGEEIPDLHNDMRLFEIWAKGKTGVPFIDANMRELAATGFMSNRGRQNVASFLVKDLKVNWQIGAEWFESLLVDYDVCSNYGNWNYIAGVGNDPRENRYFNILTQALRYDEQGDYVKHWCCELSHLPQDRIHRPDKLSQEEQTTYSVKIGATYPKAVVNIAKWDR